MHLTWCPEARMKHSQLVSRVNCIFLGLTSDESEGRAGAQSVEESNLSTAQIMR